MVLLYRTYASRRTFVNGNRGPNIYWVVLVTGDSDFGPVFRRLREMGKGVVGVGPSSVLSNSVSLSCHDYILTDAHSKRRGKGSREARDYYHSGTGYGCARAGMVSTRLPTPPHALSARGGFRVRHQRVPCGVVPLAGTCSNVAERYEDTTVHQVNGHRVRPPLLLDNTPAQELPNRSAISSTTRDMRGAMGARALPSGIETRKQASTTRADGLRADRTVRRAPPTFTHEERATVEVRENVSPVLHPGELLIPSMLGSNSRRVHTNQPSATAGSTISKPSSGAGHHVKVYEDVDTGSRVGNDGDHTSRHHSACNYRAGGRGGAGLGALSVIRPSEKLYQHLLGLDSKSINGAGSLASDWGYGLSEVALAKGLISLASACGYQNTAHSRAMEALMGATRLRNPAGVPPASNTSAGSTRNGEGGGTSTGFPREEACRIAALLQRCGFLSWLPEEQQWLVTVPADVEVLRRRRDDILMEELRTRCQEAGVPFAPALATNLLWATQP